MAVPLNDKVLARGGHLEAWLRGLRKKISVLDVLYLRYPQYICLAMSNRLCGPEIQGTSEVKGMGKKLMDYVYVK